MRLKKLIEKQEEAALKDVERLFLFDFCRMIFFSVSSIILLLTFVFRLAVIDGPSMNNTLQHGDCVLITNYQTFFDYTPGLNLKAGDVVAVAPDIESHHEHKIDNAFIKRVIATEGQTIGFDTQKGAVYIDGKIIKEPYISSKTLKSVEWNIPDKIPEGKVFVMGDNRAVSVDSRSSRIQLVDKKDIIGKAQIIVFPFNRFSYIYK